MEVPLSVVQLNMVTWRKQNNYKIKVLQTAQNSTHTQICRFPEPKHQQQSLPYLERKKEKKKKESSSVTTHVTYFCYC